MRVILLNASPSLLMHWENSHKDRPCDLFTEVDLSSFIGTHNLRKMLGFGPIVLDQLNDTSLTFFKLVNIPVTV